MNATLSKNRDQIILANGNVYLINNGETVADFMTRVRDLVKSTTGEVINIKKEAANIKKEAANIKPEQAIAEAKEAEPKEELSELEKFKRELLAAAMGNRPKAKTPLPEMTEEQREAYEKNELSLKALREQQAEEKRKKREEEKAKREAEKAAAAEELRKKREAELEAQKATRQADVDAMIAEANKVAEQMMAEGMEALQEKVTNFVNAMVEKATHYLNTGVLPTSKSGKTRTPKDTTASSGEGIDPDPNEVAHIRGLVGTQVSFERNGETLIGEVSGCGIDRRQGLAMFKIKVDGKTYYKSYARIDDLTFAEAE